MTRAVVVLADLYPESGHMPALESVPRLAVLERCLARAEREPLATGGWRSWLAGQLGAPAADAMASTGCWFATPVHYVAGLDTLRLHPDGLLRLSLQTQQQLAADFAKVFADTGWRLLPTDARDLLLQGPALDAEAPDPALFRGQSARDAAPRGGGSAPLRQLQSEIEMWLHESGVYGTTQSPPLKINGLWLWGRWLAPQLFSAASAAADGSRTVSESRAQVYADDLGARASAAAAGVAHFGLPERWPADERPGDRYVVITVQGMNVSQQMAELEQRWLQPALAALSAGQITTLELVCGLRHWRLNAGERWRFWRRRSHWLPELLAC